MNNDADENSLIADDSKNIDSGFLFIEKLSDNEFEELKNSKEFNNRCNSVDSSTYVSHKITKANSTIPNLYVIIDINSVLNDRFVHMYLLEVVEVNNNKYKVTIGNDNLDFDAYNKESYFKLWEDYLVNLNNINKVKTLKVI